MCLNRLKTDSIINSYNTRNTFGLFITGHNTKLFEENFTHSGVLTFSKLYSEIKNIEPVMKCKKMWFNFLIEKSFYLVEEFMTVDYQVVNC